MARREAAWKAGADPRNRGICGHCEQLRVTHPVTVKGTDYTIDGRAFHLPGGPESLCRSCIKRARERGQLVAEPPREREFHVERFTVERIDGRYVTTTEVVRVIRAPHRNTAKAAMRREFGGRTVPKGGYQLVEVVD